MFAHGTKDRAVQPASTGPASAAYHGAFPSRSHSCGQLSTADVDRDVILNGWLSSARTISKHLGFFTIFDHTGSVQLQVRSGPNDDTAQSSSPSRSKDIQSKDVPLLDSLNSMPLQSAVQIHGRVSSRPLQDRNADQTTGEVEVMVSRVLLLNPATRELPFQPSDSTHADRIAAEVRAKYRYLDLRRPSLANNIRLRSRITHAVRNHLYDDGFLEIETPVLLRSTPEGAREFLVPTRKSNSTATSAGAISEPAFYALPQSPQQPKQLLIASGVTDKYFQIAKCFRDEDGRKDRQPEFTQIDIEMGFVSGGPRPTAALLPSSDGAEVKIEDARDAQGRWRIGGEQVKEVIEGLIRRIWEVAGRGTLPKTFPVLSYWTAMTRFGSDKPDLRYDLPIHDISTGFGASGQSDGDIRLHAEDDRQSLEILACHHSAAKGKLSNKQLEQVMAPFKGSVERFRIANPANVNELTGLLLKKSALVRKFLASSGSEVEASEVDVDRLADTLRAAIDASGPTDAATVPSVDVFVSLRPDPPTGGGTALGDLRKALAAALVEGGLLELRGDTFAWVTEFPLFTMADDDKNALSALSSGNAESRRWQSSHHPFTAPLAEDVDLLLSSSPTLDNDAIARIRGQHYDLVLNGQEIGGGSVRIHAKHVQETVFEHVLKLDADERARFGHLIHALDCGAPPHAGIALGFDRLMAILCNTVSIRDVIAFPKQANGYDPLFGSPAPLPETVSSSALESAVDTGLGNVTTKHLDEPLLSLYGLAKASGKRSP
ncbi:hypothetical protein BCV70DRAFT_232932 [Testicularia cyperi]|uniref:Aminoacyl-transfer RNA synthetases class-II family profile domain-containing protein n=1 Tax=Testicularia cyperi TaxID=1882483 RepID=A0A317XJ95_9BASI|nr:hypothetical protein BCV70DRAFT_232932 [Testicularia cyperi]